MKNLLPLIILPLLSFGQLFTIDNDYMELYNISSINNFSENTYVNTLEEVSMSYEIIADSMPAAWDFQHCFPECHPVNTYFIDPIAFDSDSSVFLKGHFYPNNTPGEGILKMELSINHGLYLDTVVWHAIAETSSNINEQINNNQEIEYIIDLNGKIIKEISNNRNVIIKYKNGDSKMILILH